MMNIIIMITTTTFIRTRIIADTARAGGKKV